MPELAILYIIFNFKYKQNKQIQQKKRPVVVTEFKKKTCLIEQCCRYCSGTATFLKKLTLYYLWVAAMKIN